jgi:hypothetical protein
MQRHHCDLLLCTTAAARRVTSKSRGGNFTRYRTDGLSTAVSQELLETGRVLVPRPADVRLSREAGLKRLEKGSQDGDLDIFSRDSVARHGQPDTCHLLVCPQRAWHALCQGPVIPASLPSATKCAFFQGEPHSLILTRVRRGCE